METSKNENFVQIKFVKKHHDATHKAFDGFVRCGKDVLAHTTLLYHPTRKLVVMLRIFGQ